MQTTGMIKPTRSSELIVFELLGSHTWERIKSAKLPVDTIDWLFEKFEEMYHEGHYQGLMESK